MDSKITTHIIDAPTGKPAVGIDVTLEFQMPDRGWHVVGKGTTTKDGRVNDLRTGSAGFEPGTYRLTFDTASYFVASGIESFYPHVTIAFTVGDTARHYHVPLLVSPFGFSTYRGS